jgi:ribosomal protein S18 acetylase RimI-like enzyme
VTIQLTPATDADLPWLEALRRAVYADLFTATWGGWDEARHQRHFADCWSRGHVQVVLSDGERVGMLQVFERPDALEVGEIQVLPACQGRGIGTHLLRDVLARARATGRRVVLSTGLKNASAIRLYDRLGFRRLPPTGTHVRFEG